MYYENVRRFYRFKRWISLNDATKLTVKHRAAADCFTVLELLQQLKNNQID